MEATYTSKTLLPVSKTIERHILENGSLRHFLP